MFILIPLSLEQFIFLKRMNTLSLQCSFVNARRSLVNILISFAKVNNSFKFPHPPVKPKTHHYPLEKIMPARRTNPAGSLAKCPLLFTLQFVIKTTLIGIVMQYWSVCTFRISLDIERSRIWRWR